MDENNEQKHMADAVDSGSFALDEILAEYQKGKEKPREPESLSDRSKRLVMETLTDAIDAENAEMLGGLIDSAAAAETPEAEAEPPAEETAEETPEPEEAPDDAEGETEAPAPEVAAEEVADPARSDDYAAPVSEEDEAAAEEADAEEASRPAREKKPPRERLLSPVVALLALLTLRRRQRDSAAEQRRAAEEAAEEIPEPTPKKAIRACTAQMRSFRLRGRIAVALSLVMLYLSFAWSGPLPLTGALKGDIRVVSLLLIVLELSVMMTGLDILTKGLLGVARRRMGAESLIAASCVFSLLDAALLSFLRTDELGVPFCAVSAISMTFALWGEFFACQGRRATFRVLAAKQDLYTVTAEKGLAPNSTALLKSRRGIQGFIRRTGEAGYGEISYGTLSPFLLIAAVILGLLASLGRGQAKALMHCISVLTAVSATFSSTVCFSVPFAAAAKRLRQSGAAVAGWSGARDIGRSRRVVITDADVFPKGTVAVGNIRILEGTFTDKVISYTASVVTASGSGLASAFADLVRRNGYTIRRVENFEPHDGGGLTAMVNGESVCVGNTGFMNLIGIRLPQKLTTRTSLYTAINGSLVGIFNIEYRPVSSVQDALVLLLRSNLEPIFAIRDFNITPLMLKKKFRMPTDAFQFPAYSERFRISGAEPDPASRIAAVIAREGMGPLVDVAERGRRLSLGVRAAAIISLVGSIFGLLLMFLLCWMGAFDSASASNVITFMLLWLIPLALIVIAIRR